MSDRVRWVLQADWAGWMENPGARVAEAECRVEGKDVWLVATASATFAVTREKES